MLLTDRIVYIKRVIDLRSILALNVDGIMIRMDWFIMKESTIYFISIIHLNVNGKI